MEEVTLNKPLKTFDFGEETQAKIVAMMLVKPEILGDDLGVVKAGLFTNPIDQDLVRIMVQHFKKYKRPISLDEEWGELNKQLLADPRKGGIRDVYEQRLGRILDTAVKEESGFDWLKDQVLDFLRAQSMRGAVIEAVEVLIHGEDPSRVVEIIKKAAIVGNTTYRPLKNAAEVQPRERKWFWKDRIPAERLFMLVGPPQAGKSYLSLYMAAQVAPIGEDPSPWPDCGYGPERGKVLIFTNEDDWEEDIAPRIDSLGGDRNLFRYDEFEAREADEDFHLFDFVKERPTLERWLREEKNIRLILIDPLLDFLGEKLDRNQDQEVRRVLHCLKALARTYGVTICGISHLNKSTLQESWARVAGAGAWLQVPRCVYLCASDRENPNIKYFTQLKANFSAYVPGLSWAITKETGNVEFLLGLACPDAEGILSTNTRKRDPDQPIELAKAWLRKLLEDGPVKATLAEEKAKADLMALSTLQKAKNELGVDSWTVGSPAHGGHWVWGYEKDRPGQVQDEDDPAGAAGGTNLTKGVDNVL